MWTALWCYFINSRNMIWVTKWIGQNSRCGRIPFKEILVLNSRGEILCKMILITVKTRILRFTFICPLGFVTFQLFLILGIGFILPFTLICFSIFTNIHELDYIYFGVIQRRSRGRCFFLWFCNWSMCMASMVCQLVNKLINKSYHNINDMRLKRCWMWI